MGIKNFSYCNLSIDRSDPFAKPKIINKWSKLNLINWTDNPSDLEFNPENYSSISNAIISRLILSDVPDLILIERQRFRSMGSANVLETVIRSAVLENMLFASLSFLKTYDPHLQFLIQSSSPLVMTSYWENYRTHDSQIFQKNDSAAVKRYRIQLVSNWISQGQDILIPSANDDYKTKFNKISNDSRKLFEIVNYINNNELKQNDSEIHKGDDLADSLLHAITWLHFEKNKTKILQVLQSSTPENLLSVLKDIELEHILEITKSTDLQSKL